MAELTALERLAVGARQPGVSATFDHQSCRALLSLILSLTAASAADLKKLEAGAWRFDSLVTPDVLKELIS